MGGAIAFIGVTLLSFLTTAAAWAAHFWFVSVPVFLALWALAGVAFVRDVKRYGLDGDRVPDTVRDVTTAPKHACTRRATPVRRTAGARAAAA